MSNDYVPPPITTGLGQVVNNKRAQQQRNFAMQPTQAQNPVPGNSDSIFEKISKTVVGGMLNMVNTGQMASGDRPAMSAGDVGTRQVGQGVSYLNNTLNPYSNTTNKLLGLAAGKPDAANELAKSASIDAALTAAAFGAGKVVQKVAPLIKEGVANIAPARIGNKIRGETILLHGSPRINLKAIEPRLGSNRLPDKSVTYGWNVDDMLKRHDGRAEQMIDQVLTHTQPQGGYRPFDQPPGAVYITAGKTNTNKLLDPDESYMMALGQEQRVIQEFPTQNYHETRPSIKEGRPDVDYFNRDKLEADILAGLQRSGAKVKPNIVDKVLAAKNKAEAARLAKRNRNNISPV